MIDTTSIFSILKFHTSDVFLFPDNHISRKIYNTICNNTDRCFFIDKRYKECIDSDDRSEHQLWFDDISKSSMKNLFFIRIRADKCNPILTVFLVADADDLRWDTYNILLYLYIRQKIFILASTLFIRSIDIVEVQFLSVVDVSIFSGLTYHSNGVKT